MWHAAQGLCAWPKCLAMPMVAASDCLLQLPVLLERELPVVSVLLFLELPVGELPVVSVMMCLALMSALPCAMGAFLAVWLVGCLLLQSWMLLICGSAYDASCHRLRSRRCDSAASCRCASVAASVWPVTPESAHRRSLCTLPCRLIPG